MITYWREKFLRDWPSRLLMTALTAAVIFLWTHGVEAVKAEGKTMVISTVKPSIDSMKNRVDTLSLKVAELQAQQEKMLRVQQEFFGAMMEVIPGLKKSVQARGEQNSEVILKKAETERLLDKLTEANP